MPTRDLVIAGLQPRQAWGGSPNSPASYALLEQGLVIHWNGPAMGAYAKGAVPGIVYSTYDFHTRPESRGGRGWADIAYNFAVDRFGGIWQGRGDRRWNAASGTSDANSNLLAVECIIGEGDPFTFEMQAAISRIAVAYVESGRAPRCYGHRDVVATACPGEEILAFVRRLDSMMRSATVDLIPASVDIPLLPQSNPSSMTGEEEMPEYLVQGTKGTTYGVYPDGKTRELIYPELQYLEQSFAKAKKELIVVKTTNADNDQIIARRAQLS